MYEPVRNSDSGKVYMADNRDRTKIRPFIPFIKLLITAMSKVGVKNFQEEEESRKQSQVTWNFHIFHDSSSCLLIMIQIPACCVCLIYLEIHIYLYHACRYRGTPTPRCGGGWR